MKNGNFGQAIEELKAGRNVFRKGWNGKGMWLTLVPSSQPFVQENTPYHQAGLLGKIFIDAHIDMFTAKGTMQPGWLASQADMLADDWNSDRIY
jgi:hypothetical protein